MKEPVEPNKEDCCNSGCYPCIFDVFEKQLILYKKYTESGGKDKLIQSKENGLSQLQYSEFILIENIEICNDHNLLHFRKNENHLKHLVHWNPGDHILFKYTDPDSKKSTCRAYTPIRLKETSEKDSDFSIIVKRYENGVVSKLLCAMVPGESTFLRGPYGCYEITPNKYNRIIMIAQGTGIVPFISIIENILDNEDDMTKIFLYYCCKDCETILFRNELYEMKSYWNFTYRIFISNTALSSPLKYMEPVVLHKMSFDFLDLTPFTGNDQFTICGSPQFIEHYNAKLKTERSVSENNIVLF